MAIKSQANVQAQGANTPIEEAIADVNQANVESEIKDEAVLAESSVTDNNEKPTEQVIEEAIAETDLLDEKETYNIEVIQASKHLKVGDKYPVSGNVANALLKKGLIKAHGIPISTKIELWYKTAFPVLPEAIRLYISIFNYRENNLSFNQVHYYSK